MFIRQGTSVKPTVLQLSSQAECRSLGKACPDPCLVWGLATVHSRVHKRCLNVHSSMEGWSKFTCYLVHK